MRRPLRRLRDSLRDTTVGGLLAGLAELAFWLVVIPTALLAAAMLVAAIAGRL